MNNVSLVGRLTRDPDVRYSDTGTSVAKFTLAVDRRFKRDGEDSADFISCVAFGKTAEFIEKYFKQGNRMGLCGRIQTGSYMNKDNVKVYTTDVIVDNVEFVESKGASGKMAPNNASSIGDGFVKVPDDIDDDEYPFN